MMSPYRIVVAPSGFKESLSASAAAGAIAAGLRRAAPNATIDRLPLVDGGEGTAAALAEATGGRLVPRTATGPVGRPVRAHLALLGDTAVVEMAAVAGLSLVPPALRDPGATTTRGVGELIRAALDLGVRRVLVGCGDSGTSDGGAGALQALGVRLTDAAGRELPPGGAALTRLHRIDPGRLDPRLAGTELVVACNPYNVLCGPRGVARVFGPQKGADPAGVEELSTALERWATVLARDVAPAGLDLRSGPGTGASGGLGAGLAALGARLLPRFDVLLDHVDLDGRLAGADLVVTAEGALDRESARGKIPGEVARRAKALGVPVLVLAGTIGEGAHEATLIGVDAWSGILPAPVALSEALARGEEFLADAAERALRMVLLGSRVASARRGTTTAGGERLEGVTR
ncbi:glycerate kinase [Streptomyces profundus]|uniref:glycerate kinase family protein n=1 Tax=Streptomyces profundus TaxID=2867410 RepID=UPI001D16B9C6|nr:glycerate kinase [Streptomyces sp. MA3_2.13]UED87826.1 glycerate kinase [Streptomyces sp. MA3_2.13]